MTKKTKGKIKLTEDELSLLAFRDAVYDYHIEQDHDRYKAGYRTLVHVLLAFGMHKDKRVRKLWEHFGLKGLDNVVLYIGRLSARAGKQFDKGYLLPKETK